MSHVLWPKTLQVNVEGHDESNSALINVFHVNTPDVPTQADCDAVAGIVAGWLASSYHTLWALNISSDRVVVTDVSDIDGFQSTLPAAQAGTLVGVAVSSNVTLAVKKSTGRRGRANRGDWYAWPATTAQLEPLDSNLWQTTHRDNVVASLNALRTALLGASYPVVVASEATGLTREVVEFVCTDRIVDSQRRRLPGRGR